MFSINIQGGKPIYEQLYARIAELILNGGLKSEEKLPPVREVAKDVGINPNTVQKAYQALEQNGLIYSVPAKGSYVCKLNEASETIRFLRKKHINSFGESAEKALSVGVTGEELRTKLDDIITNGGNSK